MSVWLEPEIQPSHGDAKDWPREDWPREDWPRTQASIGFWNVNLETARVVGDDVFARALGLEAGSLADGVGVDEVLLNLRAEDRLAALSLFSDAAYVQAVERAPYGVRRLDGDLVWVSILRNRLDTPGYIGGVVIDVTAQTEVREAVEASELRFRALAEAVPQNVFSTDAHGVHDYLNRRWFEFTGEPLGVVDAERWLEFLHPDDVERTIRLWEACVAQGTPYDIEYRYLRHDKQYRWMRVMALPERDAEGQITRWFGTATDIHDAKMLEAEREVIAAELNHRIKNLFSIFGGLVSLSARADERAGEFAEAVQKRLSSLAIAHELIDYGQGRGEVGGACSLQALLAALAKPYGEAADGLMWISGPDLMISKAATTPITLIAHELLTNAVKYGALSRAGGAIAVETRDEGESLVIDWRETWPWVLESTVPIEGFGSGMLATVVDRLMQGQMRREIEAGGLWVQLVLPLDRVT